MLISSKEFKEKLKSELKENHIQLLDVRTPEEFANFHLETAQLIPLSELTSRAQEELNLESDIIVYCARGIRSLTAAQILISMGFKKVRSLHGGLDGLSNA